MDTSLVRFFFYFLRFFQWYILPKKYWESKVPEHFFLVIYPVPKKDTDFSVAFYRRNLVANTSVKYLRKVPWSEWPVRLLFFSLTKWCQAGSTTNAHGWNYRGEGAQFFFNLAKLEVFFRFTGLFGRLMQNCGKIFKLSVATCEARRCIECNSIPAKLIHIMRAILFLSEWLTMYVIKLLSLFPRKVS